MVYILLISRSQGDNSLGHSDLTLRVVSLQTGRGRYGVHPLCAIIRLLNTVRLDGLTIHVRIPHGLVLLTRG